MFDIGWSELLVVGVVALIVIPPKDLPGALRNAGRAVGKLKEMAGQFRSQFNEAMREAEIHEIRATLSDAQNSASSALQAVETHARAMEAELQAEGQAMPAQAGSGVGSVGLGSMGGGQSPPVEAADAFAAPDRGAHEPEVGVGGAAVASPLEPEQQTRITPKEVRA